MSAQPAPVRESATTQRDRSVSEERCITLELLAGERGQRASDLDFYLISHAIPYDSTRQLVPWAVAIKLLPEGSIVRRSLTALEQMAEVEA